VIVVAAPPVASPASADEPVFASGPSDAESLDILSGLYNQSGGPGTLYWWDHTDLTVAVFAAPNADPELVAAIHDGIATWSAFLSSRFPIVSLTDVTNSANPKRADITLHYAPHSGGVAWGGQAICGNQRCRNVMLTSDAPPGGPYLDFDATRVHRMTVHELGHALGLGHAAPLLTSTDIMAYGWVQHVMDPDTGKFTYVYSTPILSDCDLAGLAAVFEWALNSEEPHPATVGSVNC
jgi:hypothetical protein